MAKIQKQLPNCAKKPKQALF